MTALLIRLALTLWKPIAALLAALGLYAKGRADARARADLQAARDYQQTMERAADAPVHSDPATARQRMRDRDPGQR